MKEAIEQLFNEELLKAVLSNPQNKDTFKKVVIRQVQLKNKRCYQFEKYTQKQVFHENVDAKEACALALELMQLFKQCDANTRTHHYLIKRSKKDKVFISKKEVANTAEVKQHNRSKKYLIPDGTFVPPLYDLGVFSKEGKVIHAMYDKYKQINRFIEMIDDSIPHDMTSLRIIDFGCGKSYLTFILYYYLVFIKKLKVDMIGLDLKEDVIHKCNAIAQKYGYDGLHFEVGDINGYHLEGNLDMVISLHACDTASDYALYNAIQWQAKMIFCVPCCQHELNQQMKSEHFAITTKYGLLKERMASLFSDQIRANLLESCSYKVQVLEFIDITHSPKNILLRCVKSDKISEAKKAKAIKEVEALMEEYHLQPTLYELLKKKER